MLVKILSPATHLHSAVLLSICCLCYLNLKMIIIPNLVNLSGAENFRSASLSSRDYVKTQEPFAIGYQLSAFVNTTFAHVMATGGTKPIKFCKYQSFILCNRLFKVAGEDRSATNGK